MNRWFSATLLLALSLGLPQAGIAARMSAELQQAAQRAGAEQEIPVMVVLEAQFDLSAVPSGQKAARRAILQSLRQVAEESQAAPRAALLARRAKDLRSLWIINALAARVPASEVAGLASLPGVSEVRLDRTLQLPARPAAQPASGISALATARNIALIGAPALWERGLTGAGVVVASMDSGVDLAHPDLAPGWRGGSNSWFDPNDQHPTPFDNDGHGTGTLGLAVGRNSGLGVAPGASWIAVKIFDDAGNAINSRIHQGFQWLLDPDGNPATDDAPDVVNNSWGFEQDAGLCDALAREFQPDVQKLKATGIAVVFAAGNTGPNPSTSVSPANYPESVAVGAVDASLQVPLFSARGPSACDGRVYPDLVAPGTAIQVPDLTAGGTVLNSYQTVDGTSFSTPSVTGVMALLLSDPVRAKPTPAKLEDALKRSATDLGPPGPDNAYGAGLVNALAADNLLNTLPMPASLISPVDGATELEIPVTCFWTPGSDADGDRVIETLVLATSADFSGATSFPVAAIGAPVGAALLAGAFGLLGCGCWRRRPGVALALLVGAGLMLVSCGGGGGGGSLPASTPSASASLTLDGLQPATTYYWKVQSSDGRGVSESATRRFTTRR